jgi:hypothetical protein
MKPYGHVHGKKSWPTHYPSPVFALQPYYHSMTENPIGEALKKCWFG